MAAASFLLLTARMPAAGSAQYRRRKPLGSGLQMDRVAARSGFAFPLLLLVEEMARRLAVHICLLYTSDAADE